EAIPGAARAAGREHAAVLAVAPDAGEDALADTVEDHPRDEPFREPGVGRDPRAAAVDAAHHARAVGAEEHEAAGQGDDRVDDQLLLRRQAPRDALVLAHPEPLDGAGEDQR